MVAPIKATAITLKSHLTGRAQCRPALGPFDMREKLFLGVPSPIPDPATRQADDDGRPLD